MGDDGYGREVLHLLVTDTRRQQTLIEEAIARQDGAELKRLAHYCKGACDGVGARSSAALLRAVEEEAARGNFQACRRLLDVLPQELEKLEKEAAISSELPPV